MKLEEILKNTIKEGYAVGSFSPRYLAVIRPVLEAAAKTKSPVIVQISQKELGLYGCTPKQFADEYRRQCKLLNISVPCTLHLDHTKTETLIHEAIDAGFESVMIDASEKEFEENIEISRRLTAYAHNKGVSVEAELGRIGANDCIETDGDDSESYTKPDEAKEFAERTGVDALAVSVGTAHGVYNVRKPAVQFDIIRQIKKLTPVYLVLHGGSGVPPEMVEQSYRMAGGGISKVNIATDLELAFLEATGNDKRLTNKDLETMSSELLEKGLNAVRSLVEDRIKYYLHSDGKAW